MAGFRVDVFRGIRPRVNPRLLPEGEAQTAENSRLGSGSLEPWNAVLDSGDTVQTDSTSIHRMDNNGDPLWLESSNDVDYARGPVPNDDLERTYYTGETEPRMTYIGIADDPDYRILGIPAPATAPTLVGDALPVESITGTSTEGSFATNYLKADVSYSTGWIDASGLDWYMTSSIGGYESPGTVREFAMDFYIGQEMRVASVVDANNVTLEDAHGANFLAKSTLQDRSHPTNNFRDADTGTTRAAYFRFYVPNGIKVTLTAHTLQVGDVVRITSIPSAPSLVVTQVATGSLAGLFFGATTTGHPSNGSSTWPAPITMADDGFYVAGSQSFPFVEVWADIDGAVGTDEFTMQGSFVWELIERDGQSYTSLATDIESRVYVYTFVSELGEEGPPSPASAVVTIPTQGDVVVGTFDTPPSTKRNITQMRIYRANTGTDQTVFQFVAEINSPFADYTDSISDLDLGELLQTESWEPPPSDMVGLLALPNGGMAGFTGKTLCLSEPYYPHAWPPEYQIAVDYDIVGLGIVPNGVAILTKGPVYIASGDHPRAMSSRHFNDSQSCVSKRSIANTTDGVVYAAPDGLAFVGSSGFQLLTQNHAKKREWQEFSPETFQGFWHDGKYIAFTTAPGSSGTTAITFLGKSAVDTFDADTSFSYTLPAGTSNRMIVVAVYNLLNGGPITGITYGGVAMTMMNVVGDVAGSSVHIGRLSVNGHTFANDIVAVNGSSGIGAAIAYVFDNVDPASVVPATEATDTVNTTTNFDVSITVPAVGDLVFALGGTLDGAPVLSGEAGYTFERFYVNRAATQYRMDTSGAQDIDFTATTNATDSCIAAFVVTAVAAAAPPAPAVSGIVFDPQEEGTGLSTLDLTTGVQAAHLVAEEDALFVVQEGDAKVYEWDADTANQLTTTWKSGRVICPYPLNLGAARVLAETYVSVVFKLYNNRGTLVTTRTVTTPEVFRLPSGYLTDWFEIEIITKDEVTSVQLAETVGELLRG